LAKTKFVYSIIQREFVNVTAWFFCIVQLLWNYIQWTWYSVSFTHCQFGSSFKLG